MLALKVGKCMMDKEVLYDILQNWLDMHHTWVETWHVLTLQVINSMNQNIKAWRP